MVIIGRFEHKTRKKTPASIYCNSLLLQDKSANSPSYGEMDALRKRK